MARDGTRRGSRPRSRLTSPWTDFPASRMLLYGCVRCASFVLAPWPCHTMLEATVAQWVGWLVAHHSASHGGRPLPFGSTLPVDSLGLVSATLGALCPRCWLCRLTVFSSAHCFTVYTCALLSILPRVPPLTVLCLGTPRVSLLLENSDGVLNLHLYFLTQLHKCNMAALAFGSAPPPRVAKKRPLTPLSFLLADLITCLQLESSLCLMRIFCCLSPPPVQKPDCQRIQGPRKILSPSGYYLRVSLAMDRCSLSNDLDKTCESVAL